MISVALAARLEVSVRRVLTRQDGSRVAVLALRLPPEAQDEVFDVWVDDEVVASVTAVAAFQEVTVPVGARPGSVVRVVLVHPAHPWAAWCELFVAQDLPLEAQAPIPEPVTWLRDPAPAPVSSPPGPELAGEVVQPPEVDAMPPVSSPPPRPRPEPARRGISPMATVAAAGLGALLARRAVRRPARSARPARRLLGMVARFLALALLGYGAVAAWGRQLADEALAVAGRRTAVEVRVAGSASPVGFLYGSLAPAGRGREVAKRVSVDPSAVAPGGRLHLWWEATKVLEDSWHDSPLGVHPRILRVLPPNLARAASNRIFGTSFDVQGASSLSDQTCGRLVAGTSVDARRGALARKFADIACGIGLRHRFLGEPHVIGALYATHAPFAVGYGDGVEVFARQHWGFAGTSDPRLSRGHQLVLAALPKLMWNGRETRFQSGDPAVEDIETRATVALDALVAQGVVPAAERDAVRAEILAARPWIDGEYPASAASVQPDAIYRPALRFAREELVHRFGGAWAAQVDRIVLTVSPAGQQALADACRDALATLPPPRRGEVVDRSGARCAGLVTRSDGAAVAAWVGRVDGADDLDLLRHAAPPGSLGKLFLANGVVAAGQGGPTEQAAFAADLQWSRSEILAESRAVGVSEGRVRELITCYGDSVSGASDDALEVATLGGWDTSAVRFTPFLHAAWAGRAVPEPHVVAQVGRRGEAMAAMPVDVPGRHSTHCAGLAHAGGGMRPWLAVPLDGTLATLRGVASGGKTGTVPPVGTGSAAVRGTNAAWVAGLAPSSQGVVAGVFFVADADSNAGNLGDRVSGGGTVGPVARDVFRALR